MFCYLDCYFSRAKLTPVEDTVVVLE